MFARGNIARVYLYMNERYRLKLSNDELEKLETWNEEDKVDAKECKIYQTIYKIQGHENSWLKSSCDGFLKNP